MTEDIFNMSNVRIFKEIEKKKMGDAFTLLCLPSAGLSKSFGLRNLCYSIISVVHDCWNLAKIQVRAKKNVPCAQMLHI